MEPLEFKVKYSDIVAKQATINIGTIGHVSHGKSTIVGQLTGERTQKHEDEIKQNKTIYIGYADAKVWRCPESGQIALSPGNIKFMVSPINGKPMTLIQHISFVDCPGHADYMCTMIGGTCAMDAVFLLIAVNDKIFPQVQTYEHLLAMATTSVDNYLILQNKTDLTTKSRCIKNKKDIEEFIIGSPADKAPIVPVSAQLGINMDVIGKYIYNGVKQPKLSPNDPFKMFIIRSFDNNKPNTPYKKIIGGSVGGSIMQGCAMIDDYLEIRPGYIYRNESGFVCQPIISKVKSLYCGKEPLDIAFQGGLKAIGMDFDPALSKLNGLAGQIVGTPGTLPKIYQTITIQYKRLSKDKKTKTKMLIGEEIVVCVNAKTIPAKVVDVGASKVVTIELSYPVCIDTGLKMVVMRKFGNGNKDDKHNKLVIHSAAKFVAGNEIPNIVYPPEYQDIVNNLPKRNIVVDYDLEYPVKKSDEFINYESLLDNVEFKSEENEDGELLELANPEVVRHNRDSIIVNYRSLYSSFDQESKVSSDDVKIQKLMTTLKTMECEMVNISEFLTNFIKDELKTTASINDREQLILRGNYQGKHICGVMTKFAKKYSLCSNCGSYDTLVIKQKSSRSKIMSIACIKCSATSSIH